MTFTYQTHYALPYQILRYRLRHVYDTVAQAKSLILLADR